MKYSAGKVELLSELHRRFCIWFLHVFHRSVIEMTLLSFILYQQTMIVYCWAAAKHQAKTSQSDEKTLYGKSICLCARHGCVT